jgi:putative hydrolase
MSDGPEPMPGENDPFSAMFGGFDPANMGAAFTELGAMLSYEGAVNWKLAADGARTALASAGDPPVTPADRAAIEEAVRLADLWLDPATVFPGSGVSAAAWTRTEWVDSTLDGWRFLVEPLAARAGEAMGTILPQSMGAEMPPEMAAMAGPLAGMFKQLGGALFGAQLGEGLSQLAGDVLGATDVGVPLTSNGAPALVPANVAAFGEGLGIPLDQVRLYVALREVAHQRLFAHVPWLRGAVASAVEDYARGIHVDTAALEQAVGTVDMNDPEALQNALASGMFEPADTEEQKAALSRLETLLALVEGWVDAVVAQAAGSTLPSAVALQETIRRRRASGGPAEQTFATLVGLELRPRRLREASALWDALREHRGLEGRDAVWAHPDLLPSVDDLDDVDAFVHRTSLDLSALEGLDSVGDDTGADAPETDAGEGDEPNGDDRTP